MNIILLGAPGSGKGTISEKIIKEKTYTQVSTGDLMRKEIKLDTDLGRISKQYINEGKLVPDSIVNKLIEGFLKIMNNRLIFDGYPRTIEQAEVLYQILKQNNSKIHKVFYLNIDENILIKRIVNRLICPACKVSYNLITRKPKINNVCDFDDSTLVRRPDDTEEKIKIRLEVYNRETKPLLNFYKKHNILIEVDVNNKSVSEIYEQISGELD